MLAHKVMILAAEGRIPNEEKLLSQLSKENFVFEVFRSMDDLLEELSSPSDCVLILFAEYATWCRDNPCVDECGRSTGQCYKAFERWLHTAPDFVMYFLAKREDVAWLYSPYHGSSSIPGYFSADSQETFPRVIRIELEFRAILHPEKGYFNVAASNDGGAEMKSKPLGFLWTLRSLRFVMWDDDGLVQTESKPSVLQKTFKLLRFFLWDVFRK